MAFASTHKTGLIKRFIISMSVDAVIASRCGFVCINACLNALSRFLIRAAGPSSPHPGWQFNGVKPHSLAHQNWHPV
jgi:hypothetical protein